MTSNMNWLINKLLSYRKMEQSQSKLSTVLNLKTVTLEFGCSRRGYTCKLS